MFGSPQNIPVSNLLGQDLGLLGQDLGLPKLVGQKLGKPKVVQSLGQDLGMPELADPSYSLGLPLLGHAQVNTGQAPVG